MKYNLEVVNHDGSEIEMMYTSKKREDLWEMGHELTFEECQNLFEDEMLWNGETYDIWVTSNDYEDVPVCATFAQEYNGLYHTKYDMNGDVISKLRISKHAKTE